MQERLDDARSDNFKIMFLWLLGGLDDFVDKVVPR